MFFYDEQFIVVITADQFGLPPVFVGQACELRLQYVPGDPEIVAQHVRDIGIG